MTGIMSLLKGVSVAYFLSVLCLSSAELSTSRLQRAVNTFSVNLLKELSGAEPENLVVSPISVSTLLAILHQGAGLNTSRQLESVLRLTQRESKEGYGRLSRSFGAARNTSAVLEVANRVFLNQGLELRQEFQDLVSQDFQAGVEQVDFLSGEGAATINSWVSQATHGRIPNIVGTVVPPDTVLVLANAIYFKSPWRHPFSRWTTTDKAFSPRQGSEVTVPFMHLGKRLRAGEDEALGVKWVQLPFDDGGFSMLIVVPNEKHGLGDVLSNLTADNLNHFIQDGSRRFVSLDLPRFRLNSNINLESALKELGAKDIFDPEAADLRGVTSAGRVVVSKVLQKADIDVDEDGATAAAATVMEVMRLSSRVPINPFTITADHPFLGVLTGANGTVLFIAVVGDPSG